MKSVAPSVLAYAASTAPELDITVQADYVHARPRASMPSEDVATAERVYKAIDCVLASSVLRAVLFDSREMRPNSPEVREVYLGWAGRGRYHDRIAIVLYSEIRLISHNMTVISRNLGATLRSFHDIGGAVGWLRQRPRAPISLNSR